MSDDLGKRLLEASELHGDFVVSSGKRSSVYFDEFRFLTGPELLRESYSPKSVIPWREYTTSARSSWSSAPPIAVTVGEA